MRLGAVKRCSSCKLLRRIELFKNPGSPLLFNTCCKCRQKKKKNYYKQKERHGTQPAPVPILASSIPYATPCDVNQPSCNAYFTQSSVQSALPQLQQLGDSPKDHRVFLVPVASKRPANPSILFLLPRSQWISVDSKTIDPHVTCTAKALFHFTLFNNVTRF